MRWRLFDGLWLIGLTLFVLAGTHLVPFHGDESTTIWMSKDAAYWFTQGDVERLRYEEDPAHPDEQQLRLISGSLGKYLIGASWGMNGYNIDDINEQWHWGFDWNWNIQNGHAPDERLLMLGRWPSALMLAASVWVMFALGWQLFQRPTALIASVYYALHPVILLNGRRAMFEGGLLLFSLLVVLLGVLLLKEERTRHRWMLALLLGVCSGLALSAKHPAVFTVAPVFGMGVLYALRSGRGVLISQMVLAVGIGAVVFLSLNPVWWGDLFTRVGHVLDERTHILDTQVALYGGYADFVDQTGGLLRQLVVVEPQYFEVAAWENYLAQLIITYEQSPWMGVTLPLVHGLMVLMAVVGAWGIWRLVDAPTRWVMVVWAGAILITSWLLTPLEWQRYYLMCYPVVALLGAAGLWISVKQARRWISDSEPSVS